MLIKPIEIVSERLVKSLSFFIDIYAITVFPFIISREPMDETTRRHEMIHFAQQKEMLIVFFYILYAYYFAVNFYTTRDVNLSYMLIPFEREAYANQKVAMYISKRPNFNWLNYIK